jgi:hypothetical protein
VGVVGLILSSMCGILSTFTGYEIMDKVNTKLPKEDQFDPLGWYWSKRSRLHREYKRLYPSGRLFLRAKVFLGVGCFRLLIFAWSLGFFGK